MVIAFQFAGGSSGTAAGLNGNAAGLAGELAGDGNVDATLQPRLDLSPGAKEGRDLILNYSFLPPDFRQETFDDLWRDWPEPLKSKAKDATKKQRREMAFKRYGFTPRPDDPTKPMQFVVGDDGGWTMNCFTCHGGSIKGEMVEGLPNAQIALETMYADLRRTKKRRGDAFSQMDLGSAAVPMGTTVGTSNAVVFGIGLMTFRDKDLNLSLRFRPHLLTHHDMDAPAWWNVRKRKRLYIDGFVERNHRALVPFVMDQLNSGEKMRGWEDEFEKVYAYIKSLEPPKYPLKVDEDLVAKGKIVFDENCKSCHGTYGKIATYPSKVVPLKKIGTDAVRLKALTRYDRKVYHESWFAHYGKDETVLDPKGYQAPPLDGVWASAPYFHNGSVPTIEGVLNSKNRPDIWRANHDGYDFDQVGLEVESYAALPVSIERSDQRRKYFDASVRGKGNGGHTFGDKLNSKQRSAVIEYLKTL